MSYHHFYKQLEQNALKIFPGVKDAPAVTWDLLISPLELKLPAAVLKNAEAAIRALYAVSRRPGYVSQLEPIAGVSDRPTPYRSVLMAYDFHTDESGECSLVEINTNASGYLMSSIMELTHSGSSAENYAPLASLRSSFESELTLWGKSARPPAIAICDEEIEQQKMFAEFLMYRDLFRSWGWSAEFCDAKAFVPQNGKLLTPSGMPVDLVYNRLTDFYLEDPAHISLREGFTSDLACISPNPREYWLLGDKQRLVQLGSSEFLDASSATAEEKEAIARVLIPTFDKSSFESVDQIWAERKSLFFKPKRSHGGKSVYRGESVSRKVFERLMLDDILIQRYRPAQRMPTEDPRSVLSNWKFDLRFYVYEDRIQLAVARIYQGQVTNFSSPMGGFTKVVF